MNYLEYTFQIDPFQPFQEILIAQLADLEFESFVEEPPFLKAYIAEEFVNEEKLKELSFFEMDGVEISYESKLIPKVNWNKKWEENFSPIQIEDFCLIRAPFHESNPSVEHELVIEPKMSFGTGHHETTQLMIRQMKEIDFTGKSVLDMGSGTGILAILASKLGAQEIVAIDNEEWAYENMQENVERNNAPNISCYLGGKEVLQAEAKQYHQILANINKNILFDQLEIYHEQLLPNGQIVLSGFFDIDVEDFKTWMQKHAYQVESILQEGQWACIRAIKPA